MVLTLLLLVGGVAWWAGSDGSLFRALQLVHRFLPADQQLVATGAQGTLAHGGRIARLQWSRPGLAVTIEDLQLDWSLRELFRRDLRVRTLSARAVQVRVSPDPAPEPDTPFTMPEDLSLPIRLAVPLSIARVQIEVVDEDGNARTQLLTDLTARYRYDGDQHALNLDSLRHGESSLRADARLHARELTLSAQVDASLRNPVPDVPLAMRASFKASGTLAGGDAARLDLRLDADQQPAPGAEVHAQATLHPWRQQPAQQVDVQISRLDAHALFAQAPVTSLSGQATVKPVGAGNQAWDAMLEFSNAQPGAWDRQRLPVRHLAAHAVLSLEQVLIDNARLDLGGVTPAGAITLTSRIPLQQPAQATAQLTLQQVDLRPLLTSLPRTAFSGPVTVQPGEEGGPQVQADIRNSLAGPLDRERAPVERLLADLRLAPAQWRAETLQMQIATGQLQVRGTFVPQDRSMDLRGELQQLPLRRIHRRMAGSADATLSGNLTLRGSLDQSLAFHADMASSAGASAAQPAEWEIRSLLADGTWSPTHLAVQRIHLDAFQAQVDASDIDVELPGPGTIRGRIAATAPGMTLDADAAMAQQSGQGRLSLQLASATQTEQWLRGLPLVGNRLAELRADGAATLQAEWNGGWRQWVEGLKNPAAQPQLRIAANAHTDGVRIRLPALAGQSATQFAVQKLDLDLQGNLAEATLAIEGDLRANELRALLDIRMQATQVREAGPPRWNVAVSRFDALATPPGQDESWRLQVSDNLQLTVQPGADISLRASAGSASISAPSRLGSQPLRLVWQPLLWRRTANGATTLQSAGTVTGIQPAWLDALFVKNGEGPLAAAGMRTDLSLSGDWDIDMTDTASIRAHVKRDSGDLSLPDRGVSAGIRAFDVQVQSAGERVNLALDWDSERAGVITARLDTRLAQRAEGWSLPDEAPLSGTIRARVQDLTAWTFLTPPGWRMAGSLSADVRLAGAVKAPLVEGNLAATGLNLRSVLDGVELHDGTLRATLTGSRMQIDELTFKGGTGSRAYVRGFSGNRTPPPTARGRMTASGTIDWSGVRNAAEAQSGIVMDLKAQLQDMQVLVRNDRQMTLSGELSTALQQGTLRVRGNLTVDRASIVLPEASAPKLGDDVVIVRNADLRNPGAVEARQARAALQTRKPMDMEIRLDLGNDLALEGQGITTRLEGELIVRSAAYGNEPFAVFGEVRTDQGRYRAWGQALDIETGVVRFNGSYSNPTVDLLAIRPEIAVRAGVRVTGTLLAPRVQLYSDPDLPEGEKLSWVVLGRETVITGAEGTSMQQAALGLAAGQLSGRLASGLGLDELGLAESGVTLGRRISNELYLTYQQGLSGTASTLFIFYDITRRLTVRAQASEASAVDLVYTIKFD